MNPDVRMVFALLMKWLPNNSHACITNRASNLLISADSISKMTSNHLLVLLVKKWFLKHKKLLCRNRYPKSYQKKSPRSPYIGNFKFACLRIWARKTFLISRCFFSASLRFVSQFIEHSSLKRFKAGLGEEGRRKKSILVISDVIFWREALIE